MTRDVGRTCRVHDVYVLLNGTHKFRVWGRFGRGVDEVLKLILSGLEVIKRVLEASDFLNDQLIPGFGLSWVVSCVP